MLTTILFVSPVGSVGICTSMSSSPGNVSSFRRLSSLFLRRSLTLTFLLKIAPSLDRIYQLSSLTIDMCTCIQPFYPFLSLHIHPKISNHIPQMYLHSTPYNSPPLSDRLICHIQNPLERSMLFIFLFHHNLLFHTYNLYCWVYSRCLWQWCKAKNL